MDQTRNPEAIRDAIRFCGGTQKALAQKISCTQQFVSLLLNGARISAETALRIEDATSGKVPAARLRPDLFRRGKSRSKPVECGGGSGECGEQGASR